MKKQALAVFAMVTLLITLSPRTSSADAFGFGVRADIPFDFVVGTKTLPSGTYTVTPHGTSANTLIIRGQENGKSAFVLSITVAAEDTLDNSPKLIFNRYGDQYFLSQVWSGARLAGQEITKSNREHELSAQGFLGFEAVSVVALKQ